MGWVIGLDVRSLMASFRNGMLQLSAAFGDGLRGMDCAGRVAERCDERFLEWDQCATQGLFVIVCVATSLISQVGISDALVYMASHHTDLASPSGSRKAYRESNPAIVGSYISEFTICKRAGNAFGDPPHRGLCRRFIRTAACRSMAIAFTDIGDLLR